MSGRHRWTQERQSSLLGIAISLVFKRGLSRSLLAMLVVEDVSDGELPDDFPAKTTALFKLVFINALEAIERGNQGSKFL